MELVLIATKRLLKSRQVKCVELEYEHIKQKLKVTFFK